MKRSYNGKLGVLAACDGIPVILFDRNLVIVDYNSSAAEKGFEKFLGKTLAKYMSVHEASSVRSFLFVHGKSPKAPKSRLSRIEGLPGGTRALISAKEISSGDCRIKSEIAFSNLDKKPFVSSLFDIDDFINYIVSILVFADSGSENGKIEIGTDFQDSFVKIYFKTVFEKPYKETTGKISFCDFEEYYPRYAAFAHIIEYMSNIFDTLFDVEIDSDGNFIGEITVDRIKTADVSDFHSPETVDFANLVEKAFKFASIISSFAKE